jgi:hypothetical protein
MVYGAAATGTRAMTSSSGRGISLKAEGISYLASAQLPAVIVNISRGGPGLGSIQPAQSDYLQATKALGHGGFRTMVFAPATLQEAVDLTYNAWEYAERDRNPVLILMDGCLGAIMEEVELPEPKELDYTVTEDWDLSRRNGRTDTHMITPILPELALEMLNKFNVSCRNVHAFAMDEFADEDGNVCPTTYAPGLGYSFMHNCYGNIREDLRPDISQWHTLNNDNKGYGVYSKMIEDEGGADILYSATGWPGHIAFLDPNMPEHMDKNAKNRKNF